ncbi:MAG TPA: glucan biosynthesis protein [Planctomycetaceae bacterium]|nr:glucan biosynthesis protein [Planctomycetaceae bacterium]
MATVAEPEQNALASTENVPDASPPTSAPRWHDLDALRAGAMLLGIVLHAMLAHVPTLRGIWPVTDAATSSSYEFFVAAIHGFRMPLFFMLSGFFTAMLWRRRGLKSLLWHRCKRILFPLMIGTVTVVPLVWAASIFSVSRQASQSSQSAGAETIWAAAAAGDIQQLELLTAEGDLNAQEPATGATALTMAAISDKPEAVRWLLDQGADVNARNRDGATAAHVAFLFGYDKVAQPLIEAGADLTLRDGNGSTPLDALGADWPTTQFIASMLTIEVEESEVAGGKKQISEFLADTNIEQPAPDPGAAIKGLVVALFYFPFFHHLWFLWFLIWLVSGFAIYAWISSAIATGGEPSKLRRLVNRAVMSPLRYLWLIPVTMVPALAMGLQVPNFGPDTSSGLLPLPQVLLYYAVFFGFGALYYDANDSQQRLGRGWPVALPVALLVALPLGYEFIFGTMGIREAILPESLYHVTAVLFQVLYAWLMTFGLIGIFRRFFSSENKTIRYLSDSAYWLYLIHLPLVIFVQAFTAPLPGPAWFKLLAVSLGVSLVLLVSYQLLVRYTFIGTLLNGKKTRQAIA